MAEETERVETVLMPLSDVVRLASQGRAVAGVACWRPVFRLTRAWKTVGAMKSWYAAALGHAVAREGLSIREAAVHALHLTKQWS